MLLQQLVFQFLAEVTPGNTNETRQAYHTKLSQLMRFVGSDIEAGTITRDTIEAFKLDLTSRTEKKRGHVMVQGKLSPFTIRTTMVTVRFLFSWACERGYIPNNPMQGVRIPKEPPAQPKPVQANVAVSMIESAAVTGKNWERARNVALLYFFRDTGCRVGGVHSANLRDLDLEAGRIPVIEKGNKERYVFLSPATVFALQIWIEQRSTMDIFCTNLFVSKFGTPLTRSGIYHVFAHLAEVAKIESRFNPHAFRHAFARDAIEAGLDLSRLSQIMGHASIDVTNRYYSRFNVEELRRAHNFFSPASNMIQIPAVMES